MAKTQIQVDTKTRDKLLKMGTKEETYDQIILRLIDDFEENRK